MWSSLAIAKLITSLLIPLVIVILGYYFNRRLKQTNQNNGDRHRQELEAKEQERNDLERRYKYRIEFSLDATIIGVQDGFYLLEFTTTINNKSLLQKKYTDITLRVLGIEENSNIKLWLAKNIDKETGELKEQQTSRINFPVEIVKENILPPFWSNIFIEPGVKQDVTFTTRIPKNISYILATVKFKYKNIPKPHTAERIFALQVSQPNKMTTKHQGVRHI